MRLFYIILLALVAVSAAGKDKDASSPKAVVDRYCSLDFRGARLSSEGFPSIGSLYTWEVEPGWDEAVVVKRFFIKSYKIEGQRAAVRVQYLRLGTLGETFEPFETSKQSEDITFNLIKQKGSWQITSPVIPPHVSPEAAIDNIEEIIQNEGEQSRQKWANALSALKALK